GDRADRPSSTAAAAAEAGGGSGQARHGEPHAAAVAPRIRACLGPGARGGDGGLTAVGEAARDAVAARSVAAGAGCARLSCPAMKVAVSSDMGTPLAREVVEELERRGHEPVGRGALAQGERSGWAWAAGRAARD